MTPEELERIRRSIAMLAPGVMASGLSREDVLGIIRELQESRTEKHRCQECVDQLRQVLAMLDHPSGSPL